ncbi:MAG TPA: hypothetical protein PKK43_15885, partial [Spirochaetota bacterium]|nr:hypothetical protein [Spirochaetota bacterium]
MGTATGEALINAFEKVRQNLSAGYIEAVHISSGSVEVIGAKSFEQGVEFLPFETLAETPEYKKENSAIHSFTVTHKNQPLHCIAMRVRGGDFLTVILESKTPMDASTPLFAALSHASIDLALSLVTPATSGDAPTKKDLINMRQIQAMLFPTFEDIKEFDIGAVYLPSQLMSGNFIDMKRLNA